MKSECRVRYQTQGRVTGPFDDRCLSTLVVSKLPKRGGLKERHLVVSDDPETLDAVLPLWLMDQTSQLSKALTLTRSKSIGRSIFSNSSWHLTYPSILLYAPQDLQPVWRT